MRGEGWRLQSPLDTEERNWRLGIADWRSGIEVILDPFSRLTSPANDPAGYGIRSPHPGVANALFADGTVHSISENIDPEILKAIITIDAGDRGSEFHTMNEPW